MNPDTGNESQRERDLVMARLATWRFEKFAPAGDAILQQWVGQGPQRNVSVCAGGAEIDFGPEVEMGCLCQTSRRVVSEEQEFESLLVSGAVVAIHLLIKPH